MELKKETVENVNRNQKDIRSILNENSLRSMIEVFVWEWMANGDGIKKAIIVTQYKLKFSSITCPM